MTLNSIYKLRECHHRHSFFILTYINNTIAIQFAVYAKTQAFGQGVVALRRVPWPNAAYVKIMFDKLLVET